MSSEERQSPRGLATRWLWTLAARTRLARRQGHKGTMSIGGEASYWRLVEGCEGGDGGHGGGAEISKRFHRHRDSDYSDRQHRQQRALRSLTQCFVEWSSKHCVLEHRVGATRLICGHESLGRMIHVQLSCPIDAARNLLISDSPIHRNLPRHGSIYAQRHVGNIECGWRCLD